MTPYSCEPVHRCDILSLHTLNIQESISMGDDRCRRPLCPCARQKLNHSCAARGHVDVVYVCPTRDGPWNVQPTDAAKAEPHCHIQCHCSWRKGKVLLLRSVSALPAIAVVASTWVYSVPRAGQRPIWLQLWHSCPLNVAYFALIYLLYIAT